jgi:hypothetical protein
MTLRTPRLAALVGALLLAAAPAAAFISSNGFLVTATGPVTFEVRARGSRVGAIDFWCAAGEYAWIKLRASNNMRIYRLSEPPRRGGQPVFFSLNPEGKASRTGLAVIGGDDGSLSVASARNQCAAIRALGR